MIKTKKIHIKKLIEFDGLQHERYIPFIHKNKERFELGQKYDRIKDEYAQNNNISLLRIKQKDFKNIELILSKELGLPISILN
jgi:CRISPR/Cas system-associated protein endoribonuclease Cas2